MKKLILGFCILLSSNSFAFPAGQKCLDRAIQVVLDGMVCPCGTPKQVSGRQSLYVYYVDNAEGMSHHIPEEYCGWSNKDGIGLIRVDYMNGPHGDCTITHLTEQ